MATADDEDDRLTCLHGDPAVLVAAVGAHLASFNEPVHVNDSSPGLLLGAHELNPILGFDWAPEDARQKLMDWARNAAAVHAGTQTEFLRDLPDDCGLDVL
jgi:hypothetical protein